jgi:hypothetical protein
VHGADAVGLGREDLGPGNVRAGFQRPLGGAFQALPPERIAWQLARWFTVATLQVATQPGQRPCRVFIGSSG